MIGPVAFLLLVLAAIFAPLSAWFALNRDRSPGVWFILGALAGPLATVILVLGPPGRCPHCGTNVVGWPEVCPTCGAAFPAASMASLMGRARAEAAPAAGRRSAAAAGAVPATSRPPVQAAPRTAAPGPPNAGTPIGASVTSTSPPVAPPSVAPAIPAATVAAAASAPRSSPTTSGPPPARSGSRLRSGKGRQRATGTKVQDSGEQTELLATAMYVTGSHDCQPGLHYLLTLRGSSLVVLGPLETAPHDVAASRPVADVRVTAFGDGLLITDPRGIRGWSLGFQRFTGGSPESVERALLAAGAGPGVE